MRYKVITAGTPHDFDAALNTAGADGFALHNFRVDQVMSDKERYPLGVIFTAVMVKAD